MDDIAFIIICLAVPAFCIYAVWVMIDTDSHIREHERRFWSCTEHGRYLREQAAKRLKDND